MRHNKLYIHKGKFMRNGIEVRAEHGDNEQIEALRKVAEMTDEGFCPEIVIQQVVSMQFECICGESNEIQFDPIDLDDDPGTMLHGETNQCCYCKMYFKVYNDQNEGIMLKMIGYDKTKKK